MSQFARNSEHGSTAGDTYVLIQARSPQPDTPVSVLYELRFWLCQMQINGCILHLTYYLYDPWQAILRLCNSVQATCTTFHGLKAHQ